MPVIKKAKPMQPARTLCLGFLIIITVGALLLWLPFSSKSGSTSFFDCLFPATSATCVTGLVVVDTYSNWTIFGQAVIALLIQVGGLGFVTIITFFNVAAGKKLGLISQIPVYPAGFSVEDVLRTAFAALASLKRRMEELEKTLEKDASRANLSEYDRLSNAYLTGGGYEQDTEVDKVCNGLGIPAEMRGREFDRLPTPSSLK